MPGQRPRPDSTRRRRMRREEDGQHGVRDWDRFEKGRPSTDYSHSKDRFMYDDMSYHTDPAFSPDSHPWNPLSHAPGGPASEGIGHDPGPVPLSGDAHEPYEIGEEVALEEVVEQLQAGLGATTEPRHDLLAELAREPRAAATALIARDCSYPTASTWFRQTTGAELPFGLYSTLSAQANKAHLTHEVMLPRWLCRSCSFVYATENSDDVDFSCPCCGGVEVSARSVPKKKERAIQMREPLDTARLYRQDYEENYAEHGTEPLRYDHVASFPSVETSVIRSSDIVRNVCTGEELVVLAADHERITGNDFHTGQISSVMCNDWWQWVVTGHLVERGSR